MIDNTVFVLCNFPISIFLKSKNTVSSVFPSPSLSGQESVFYIIFYIIMKLCNLFEVQCVHSFILQYLFNTFISSLFFSEISEEMRKEKSRDCCDVSLLCALKREGPQTSAGGEEEKEEPRSPLTSVH